MRRVRTTVPLAFPLALVLATGVLGTFFDRATEIYFINSLVSVSMVVALYVFVGNSGVLSFGHMSFVAVGAWTAGVLSVPVAHAEGNYVCDDATYNMLEENGQIVPEWRHPADGVAGGGAYLVRGGLAHLGHVERVGQLVGVDAVAAGGDADDRVAVGHEHD